MIGRFLSRIGMFGLLIACALAGVLAVSACATPPQGAPASEQTSPVLYGTAQTLRAVTAARQTATAALRAGKIDVSRHRDIQAKLDRLRAAAEAATATPAAIDKAKREADAIAADPKGAPL